MKMVQNQVVEVSENFLWRYPDSSWDALERSDDQNYATIISEDRDSFSLQNASYRGFFGERIISNTQQIAYLSVKVSFI